MPTLRASESGQVELQTLPPESAQTPAACMAALLTGTLVRHPPSGVGLTYTEGKVVGVRHRPVGHTQEVQAEERNLQYYWTVDGLFDLVDAALARGVTVRASYDPRLGFPTQVYIDYDANFIGDELDVRLTAVTPLAP